MKANIRQENFGKAGDKAIHLFTFTNAHGNKISITNFGGAITLWSVIDKKGNAIDCVIGFNELASYLQLHPYFGTLIGRYANRIANGKFELNNKTYTLATNDASNHLHGGHKGFHNVIWDAEIIDDTSLQLKYFSKDGEEGYPGNLSVTVVYTFTDENELIIQYKATSDKATPVNLTNHVYFNLSGSVKDTIHFHELFINANAIVVINKTQIPTGNVAEIKGTEFDFSSLKKIPVKDFDHCYILNKNENELALAATVIEKNTGIELNVFTTEPAIQFYSGNNLDGSFINKDGSPIKKHTAFCLETQHYPDSPNHPHFPNTILQPGEEYLSTTIYQLANTTVE